MPIPSRRRTLVAAGVGVLATGAWLLLVGYQFVDAWFRFSSSVAQTGPGPTCLCPLTQVQLRLGPDPTTVIASYAVATPFLLVAAWWVLRTSRRTCRTEREGRRLRVAGILLLGSLALVPAYLAVGVALDALGLTAPPSLRYPFLGLLIVVPVILLVAASLILTGGWRRPLSGTSPTHPG